ncbi:MAG: bifunctional 2-polyprenyl-6-hydroxyphenol methylase/3-demethylubiquinol 3-O-methyltransferase UbiG [Sneathiellaceae bacterium]
MADTATASNSGQAAPGDGSRRGGGATADAAELARFDALSAEAWWDTAGEMAGLHALNPVRLDFLCRRICAHFGRDPGARKPLAGLRIVDIGCGGGLLAEPLARLGATVTGIDAAPAAIAVARSHAAEAGLQIAYEAVEAAVLVQRAQQFDAVLAMEIVEHVAAPQAFLDDCAALIRPGGFFAAATLSRTARAFALAILGAEYLLRLVPRGTHDWRKFLKPHELARLMRQAGITLGETSGMSYDPVRRDWRLSRDLSINYLVSGSRPA